MILINYIHANIKKIVSVYVILGLVFIAWMVFSVLRGVKVEESSKVPTYSISKIESINKKLEERMTIETEKQIELQESDYGKDEPFR